MEESKMYKGIGASGGIAIGKAFVLPTWEWEMPEQMIDVSDLAKEFERLSEGVRTSKSELEYIKKEISGFIGAEESTIFDAHMAILEDPVFMNEIQGIIQRQYKAAEVAVKEAIDKFAGMFDLLDDDYMKERALDIKDVGNRLLKHLLGTPDITLPADNHPFVLVAKEISPSQLAHLNPANVTAIVTVVGGKTSHSAIMARAMGIPFVLGVEEMVTRPIATGDLLIVDGEAGRVYSQPKSDILLRYSQRREQMLIIKNRLKRLADVPAVTRDGKTIQLSANISSLKEVDEALVNGATGVGLFRTEFLYMDRNTLPRELEQFEVYRSVAEKLSGRPLIIRTLDIGGDKQLDTFMLPEEDNPFLGYRAIRICLDHTEFFKTQLKAILRSTPYGDVKIMYPMISSVQEVLQANEVLKQAKLELKQQGVDYRDDVEVGIMIEVPAAAQIADLLAEEVDFFSIGTNDLIQYVLAVDRMNDKIAHLYDPYHPAIIRLLKTTIEAAHRKGIPVGVCGEMAGDLRALPIWLGLGVTELSMSSQSILPVKNGIIEGSVAACAEVLKQVLRCSTGEQISELLVSYQNASTEAIGGK